MIGQALLELADMARCVGGDMHLMHLNVRGAEFDVAHAFLGTYYEEADEDYDTWAEAALMFEPHAQSPNESASRIGWQSFDGKCTTFSEVVQRVDDVLGAYLDALTTVFEACGRDPREVGVAATLQARVEHWSKARSFFNSRRRSDT